MFQGTLSVILPRLLNLSDSGISRRAMISGLRETFSITMLPLQTPRERLVLSKPVMNLPK